MGDCRGLANQASVLQTFKSTVSTQLGKGKVADWRVSRIILGRDQMSSCRFVYRRRGFGGRAQKDLLAKVAVLVVVCTCTVLCIVYPCVDEKVMASAVTGAVDELSHVCIMI